MIIPLVTIPVSVALQVFRPCGQFSGCRGDEDPRVRVDCADDQCLNASHVSYRPCSNPWHELPEEARALLRSARQEVHTR